MRLSSLLEGLCCRAVDLAERYVPKVIPPLCSVAVGRHGLLTTPAGRASRTCRRLTQAMQARIVAGDQLAMDLALRLAVAGAEAPRASAAYWGAHWSRRHLLPCLPGRNLSYALARTGAGSRAASPPGAA
jgi:hypothetical protein